jgi:hypothetical protein
MSEDSRISEFLEKAITAGIPQQSIVGLLTANGWREKDVYRALGKHFRTALGIDIPRRADSASAAKDAFCYLLIFSTLAIWTLSVGSLAFLFINRWLSDPLFSSFEQQIATYQITWSIAAIMVAYPLYLLLSRAVLRDTAVNPEKLDSGIRKWLTYMALVLAASIFMGDLICALAFLLRGEITSRFLAKSFVVLALSGGVFSYYFAGLRKSDDATVPSSRDRIMAALSASVVALILILGFLQLGPPRSQRDYRADEKRVQELYQLSSEIQNYWRTHASQLPPTINALPGTHLDPVTHAQYEYQHGQGSQFTLCATFSRDTPSRENSNDSDPWNHSAGRHCFPMDATAQLTYPMQYAAY